MTHSVSQEQAPVLSAQPIPEVLFPEALSRPEPETPQNAEQGFGPHLMLDCKGCNLEKIADVAYIFEVLNTLPEKVGMTKITQPYVFPYSGLVPEDKGVTGVVIIAESHLSFHSFVEKDYFFFDLFSCKPFDVQAAKQFIIEAFEVTTVETHYVERGQDFPRGALPVSSNTSSVESVTPLAPNSSQTIALHPPIAETIVDQSEDQPLEPALAIFG